MRIRTSHLLAPTLAAIALIANGCGDSGGNDPAPMPEPVLCGDGQMPGFTCRDLSTFRSFQFIRQPHTGFCPPTDAVFNVAVTVNLNGVGLLQGTLLNRPAPPRSECPGGFLQPGCLDQRGVERTLTAQELARLQSAFRSTELSLGRDPACEPSDTPCVVNSFRWDSLGAIDLPCSPLSISDRDARRLIPIIEDLVRATLDE